MNIIAFYLPQFHSFPENDYWWGQGFTEWTLLEKALPYKSNHIIKRPHSDLGYYCLENQSIRAKQAEIAKKYSIYGFCYYHYWFGDKVLMQKPLELMLQDGEPNIPFCLSWANEPWRRMMNGGSGDIIQPTNYGGIEEWQRHLDYLCKYFLNKNYILIDNKPVLLIYRVVEILNFQQRFNFWNEQLKKMGFNGIYLIMTLGNFKDDFNKMYPYVSATVDFHPNFFRLPNTYYELDARAAYYDLNHIYPMIVNKDDPFPSHFRGFFSGFDSSPRNTNRCNIFLNNSPELYQKYLRKQMSKNKKDFLFINAWNEWGEGAVLEPTQTDNYTYLECTKKVNHVYF